jgi:hypothetical protein
MSKGMKGNMKKRAWLCGTIYLLLAVKEATCIRENSRFAFLPPVLISRRQRLKANEPRQGSPTELSFSFLGNDIIRNKENIDRYSTADDSNEEAEDDSSTRQSRRQKLQKRVSQLAKSMVIKPISYASPNNPVNAVEMAVDEVFARRSRGGATTSSSAKSSGASAKNNTLMDALTLVNQAFLPVEESLQEMEQALQQARHKLAVAKKRTVTAMEMIQTTTMAVALEGAVQVVEQAEQDASRKVLADIYAAAVNNDIDAISSVAFEDVDYGTSEMAPPFLGEDQCLVPGEPVVRVEKAPENSRRIFAGIDILASVDDVWRVLTDYAHLQDVVPNLSVNVVLEEYPAISSDPILLPNDKDVPTNAEQCQMSSQQLKGAKLRQVGGAKIAGINFSARTTLEVREWPTGLPDSAHWFDDDAANGTTRSSLSERAKDYAKVKLQRYLFPRPFAISSLPTRDITMQSVPEDDGEFRMYQGVWRMQPLLGCAPPGKQAMRLTYAVEISPRAYLPVQLVEGRIVRDLCNNLQAIRDFVAKSAAAAVDR